MDSSFLPTILIFRNPNHQVYLCLFFSLMIYVFSFPIVVYVGALNLIASIPGPSILTLLDIKVNERV